MGGEFAEGGEFLLLGREQKARKKEAGSLGGGFFQNGEMEYPRWAIQVARNVRLT